jgi:hypothetical protein
LRIMHDLSVAKKFESISKEELKSDLEETLKLLQKAFQEILQ